jgi:hypothetical protein
VAKEPQKFAGAAAQVDNNDELANVENCQVLDLSSGGPRLVQSSVISPDLISDEAANALGAEDFTILLESLKKANLEKEVLMMASQFSLPVI